MKTRDKLIQFLSENLGIEKIRLTDVKEGVNTLFTIDEVESKISNLEDMIEFVSSIEESSISNIYENHPQRELKSLYNRALKYYEAKDLDWDDKFKKIFSDSISKRVYELISLDYYHPDTSYEEDVQAFMCAFYNYLVKEKIIEQ